MTNTCTEYATASTGLACTANFTQQPAVAAASGGLEARNAPEPEPGSGGSVPPTGTLLEDLLVPGSTELQREREANMKALRERASRPSEGMAEGEPMLDYLLGEDR